MRHIRFLFLIFLFFACQEVLVEKPENLIEPGKMSDILYDLAVLEAMDNMYRGDLERNGIEPAAFVLDKHGVDSLQFAQSDFYYASKPVIYEQIYQEVADRLEQQRDSIGEALRRENNRDGSQGGRTPERDSL